MNAPTKTAKPVDTVTEEGEIVTTAGFGIENKSLAVSLARAEIDMQVTTAHAFPRSVDRAVKNIMSLATLDELTAEECVYALPRGGKPIKGPSVRLAEIIQSQWGNCRAGARVVHVDRIERYVEAEGVFHDLETNSATTARVRRRISDKNGKLFNEDMIVVTGNAACSIAKRNAVLGGVPKAVWRKAYDAVEHVIAGDVKTLSERRASAMKAFATFGVSPDQVFAALGLAGLDDVTLEHMSTLIGMHAALKSGEATVEEMFPKTPAAGNGTAAPKDLGGKLDDLAKKSGAAATAQTTENDAKGPAPSGGEAAASAEDGASPAAAEQASPQPASRAEAATEEAAPDAPAAQPAKASGAAETAQPAEAATAQAATWPAGEIPRTPEQYALFARTWFARVTSGAMTPADAELQWKGDRPARNKCGVEEELRDELKAELDAILAAKKKG